MNQYVSQVSFILLIKKKSKREFLSLHLCSEVKVSEVNACFTGIESHMLALPMFQGNREQSQSKSKK